MHELLLSSIRFSYKTQHLLQSRQTLPPKVHHSNDKTNNALFSTSQVVDNICNICEMYCLKSVQIRRFSPYSVRIRENTDWKKLHICTLFTQWWQHRGVFRTLSSMYDGPFYKKWWFNDLRDDLSTLIDIMTWRY